jgi:hypothetical protein
VQRIHTVGVRLHRVLCTILVLGFAAVRPRAAEVQAGAFDLAIYTGHGFELYTVESGVSRIVSCKIPVGDFSIAPNGRFVVLSSRASRAGMGLLYELDLTTGGLQQLPSNPFFVRTLNRGERELYSDPAVSPDNRLVAFTVHTVAGDDSDDLVGLAGPLAVLDLNSGRRRILAATLHVDGGPAFINGPVWSSDGLRLLIAFEVDGAIVDLTGHQLQPLGDLMNKRLGDGNASPMAWWSNHEILFVWNPAGTNMSGIGKLYMLDLRDGVVADGAASLRIPEASAHNVAGVQVNNRFVLVQHPNDTELFSRGGQLLKQWRGSNTPRLRLYR